MSYIKKIGDKEYEFASEKAYETFKKLMWSAAKEAGNGTTPTDAAEMYYQKYVDVGSPLVAQKKEVQTSVPNEATPSYTAPSVYETLYGNAEAYKNSLYGYANSSWQSSYAMAEKARQEAEALAEIERKRGVVDASTLYQQNKATYGANAEQLGRMGLNVSGYSDYLNSQAYASGMAYRQAANAQAAESKRQATYQEALSKLEADRVRDSALAQADQTYYSQLSNIALQEKADADAKEAALKAEQQAQEQQKQTNYLKMLELAASGVDVSEIAKNFGMTEEQITSIGKATPTVEGELSETEYNNLYNSYANQEASGDYVGAALTRTEMENNTASAEQKQIISANNVVASLDKILSDDSQVEKLLQEVASGKFGTKGAEIIKDAYTNSVKTLIDGLSGDKKYSAMAEAIDSGLLTDKAKTQYEKEYSNEHKGFIKIDTNNVDMSAFGTYIGSNKDESDQADYTKELKKFIESGQLEEGDIIIAKYGEKVDDYSLRGLYRYLGNGRFEKVKGSVSYDRIKVPDGYYNVQMLVKKEK